MSGIWKAILPIGLSFIGWLIKKRLAKEDLRRRFLKFILKRTEDNRSSQKLSDSYWSQVDELRERKKKRDEAQKKWSKPVRMRGRLAIIIGHEKKSPGASGAPPLLKNEWEYNNLLANDIVRIGEHKGHQINAYLRDGLGNTFSERIEKVYKNASSWGPHAIIELHFNAFNTKVRGTEVLHYDSVDHSGIREALLADYLHTRICDALERPEEHRRGVKNLAEGDGERGFLNVSRTQAIPSCLIEPFFGDNASDAELGMKLRSEIAEAVILAFEDFLS